MLAHISLKLDQCALYYWWRPEMTAWTDFTVFLGLCLLSQDVSWSTCSICTSSFWVSLFAKACWGWGTAAGATVLHIILCMHGRCAKKSHEISVLTLTCFLMCQHCSLCAVSWRSRRLLRHTTSIWTLTSLVNKGQWGLVYTYIHLCNPLRDIYYSKCFNVLTHVTHTCHLRLCMRQVSVRAYARHMLGEQLSINHVCG